MLMLWLKTLLGPAFISLTAAYVSPPGRPGHQSLKIESVALSWARTSSGTLHAENARMRRTSGDSRTEQVVFVNDSHAARQGGSTKAALCRLLKELWAPPKGITVAYTGCAAYTGYKATGGRAVP